MFLWIKWIMERCYPHLWWYFYDYDDHNDYDDYDDDDYVDDDDDDVDDKDYNDDVEDDDGEDYRQATFETLLYCPLSLLYVLKVLREMYKSCFKKCDLQSANHAESS